ncbi:hypothetical protein CY34DRAFT_803391 [Suillus luteus UH-Slu-Lm8-n1]|uniref:Uncharacterized protein n=1 Tax=Suillus luteus UH-Slu-Lm8-n1 TaxID=930992 RepID=A0A0D0APR9_9AGAM|nr:hypothetical protein CY34DRAFT_803391 [Suillus luteus UH-Slu-Lm8-n1]
MALHTWVHPVSNGPRLSSQFPLCVHWHLDRSIQSPFVIHLDTRSGRWTAFRLIT